MNFVKNAREQCEALGTIHPGFDMRRREWEIRRGKALVRVVRYAMYFTSSDNLTETRTVISPQIVRVTDEELHVPLYIEANGCGGKGM